MYKKDEVPGILEGYYSSSIQARRNFFSIFSLCSPGDTWRVQQLTGGKVASSGLSLCK